MSAIVTRAGKGSALSWIEADANLTNLNADKLEASDLAAYETSAHAAATYVANSDIGVDVQAYSANLSEYAAVNPTAAGLALLDDADAAAQRTTLGLGTAATANTGDFQAADADIPTVSASQAEMEVGSETALRSMSPLRVAQAIAALNTSGITSGTAVATTSGTSIDFTGIPSTVKRITVLLAGVSTSGTSAPILRIGDGSIVTTGYLSGASYQGSSTVGGNTTTGFLLAPDTGNTVIHHGIASIIKLTGNVWVFASQTSRSDSAYSQTGAGSKTLSGTLDRLRLTTANGTDTFDAGSINILYES